MNKNKGIRKSFKILLFVFIMIAFNFINIDVYSENATCLDISHNYKECGLVHCSGDVCTRCGTHLGVCGGGHIYNTPCTFPHCDKKICDICGEHLGICGGEHTYKTCSHCLVQYCSKCTEHIEKISCPCNLDGICFNPHCIDKGIDKNWCTLCNNHIHATCNSDAVCSLAHCDKRVCSLCLSHNGETCGGDHRYTQWISVDYGETHQKICEVPDCEEPIGVVHNAKWSAPDINHTSYCQYGCGLTYTHEPVWYSTNENPLDGDHNSNCFVVVGDGLCSAINVHKPIWGEYYKVGSKNGNGDGNTSGFNHTRDCTICGLSETEHNYADEETEPDRYEKEKWVYQDVDVHARDCNICGLRQIEDHKYDLAEFFNITSHYDICPKCDVNKEHKNKISIHTDVNKDGICDKCKGFLWKITLNGEDISRKIFEKEYIDPTKSMAIEIIDGSFDGTNALERVITKLRFEDETELEAENDGRIHIQKNGKYTFSLASGAKVTIEIQNISNEINLDVIKTRKTSAEGKVTVDITVKTNATEGILGKKVYIKEGEDEVTDSEMNHARIDFSVKKEVATNGTYYFTARDSIGNTLTIPVVVNEIINGTATVAVSNNVFVGGYVFTEILVNPSSNWDLNNYKFYITANKVDGESKYISSNSIKVVKVMDLQRNILSQGTSAIETGYLPGIYYIQLAIGGSDVFTEEGTYILDLFKAISLDGIDGINGINRIIVEVQGLNDLT